MFECIIIGLTYMLTDGTLGTKVAAIAANLEIFYWIISGIVAVLLILDYIVLHFGIGFVGLLAGLFLGLKIFLMIYIQDKIVKTAESFDAIGQDATIAIYFWLVLFILTFLKKLFKKSKE